MIRYLNQEANRGRIGAARFDGYNTRNNPWVHSKTRINDGVIHHVAFVKRGSQLALYIDGLLEDTAEDTTTGNTKNDSDLFIGARGGTRNFFSGHINHVRIWNHALSIDEIGEDMDTPASQVADTVGNWAFDEVDKLVEKVQDRSGSGNEGVLHGGASYDDVDKCEYAQKIYVDGQLRGWGLIAVDRDECVGWLDSEWDGGMTLLVPVVDPPDVGDILLLQDRQVLAKKVSERVVAEVNVADVTAATVNGVAHKQSWWEKTPVWRLEREANTMQSTTTEVNLGRSASEEGYLQGTIDDVRVWKVGRRAWQIQHYHDQPLTRDSEGLVSHWRFEEGRGRTAIDSKGSNHGRVIHQETEKIPEMWTPSARNAALSLYVNGQRVDVSDTQDVVFGDLQFSLGAVLADGIFQQAMGGIIDELRLWKAVRTREQIRDNMYRSLSGAEEDLAGYWPLDEGDGYHHPGPDWEMVRTGPYSGATVDRFHRPHRQRGAGSKKRLRRPGQAGL